MKKVNKVRKGKKLLIIAYVFPPIAYAGTFRTARLCKYLARAGYELTVLTINIQRDLHNDYQLLKGLKHIKIVRCFIVDPWRIYQRFRRYLLKNLIGRAFDKICSFVLSVINNPDHMILWVPFATVKAYKVIKNNKIRIIYTSSPPHSEQIVGILLKKLCRVRWIADLRDPIRDNIIFDDLSRIGKKVSVLLERRIIDSADHIIVNTRYAKEQLRRRYNSSKVSTVYNSFDPDDFMGEIRSKYDEFTVSHVGSIYSFRKIDDVLIAVRDLVDRHVIRPDTFRLRLIGLGNENIMEKVVQLGLQDYVLIEGFVPHAKALTVMRKSHLLLLLKGFGKNSKAQIPGKLFEYLGSQTKILYVGTNRSEAADLIRKLKAGFIVGSDWRKISQIIESEYCRVSSLGCLEKVIPDKALMKYSAPSMASKISDIIDQLQG